MADAPASPSGGKGLTRKVGPLPVWGWAVLGFGVYYWYTHYGPGASSSSATAPAGVTVGNITENLTQTVSGGTGGTGGGGGGSGGGGSGGGGTKAPPAAKKCPKGYFWDPDDRGGKGRCVRIKGHKGPDKPGSDTARRTAAGLTAGTGAVTGSPVTSGAIGPGPTGPAQRLASTRPGGPTGPAQRFPPGPGGPTGPAQRFPPGARPPRPRGGGAGGPAPVTAGAPSQTVIIMPPDSAPTGGPVSAQTGQPVYEEWQHAHRGPQVPPPIEAYAPGTSGATYGPAVADAAAADAAQAAVASG